MDAVEFINSCKDIISVDVEAFGVANQDIQCVCFSSGKTQWTSDNPSEIQKVLSDPRPKVGHNIKYDINMLKAGGYTINGQLEDTLIVAHLLQQINGVFPDAKKQQYGLKKLYNILFNTTYLTFPQLVAKYNPNIKKINQDPHKIPKQVLIDYCKNDTKITYDLYTVLLNQASSNDMKIYNTIEKPLIPIVADMERRGVLIDVERLKAKEIELTAEIDFWLNAIYTWAGHTFNINSIKDLPQVLYEEYRHPKRGKTKNGKLSVDDKALSQLASWGYELPGMILEYRVLAKERSAFVKNFLASCDKDSILHCHYNQNGADTGRFTCAKPNLQQVPESIRECIISRPGMSFISADYAQIELRILAHLARVKAFLEAFKNGEDPHAVVMKAFSVDRRIAKRVNFGQAFGGGAYVLSEATGISIVEASKYLEQYDINFPEVKAYGNTMLKQYKELGTMNTMLGRERRINIEALTKASLKSKNPEEWLEGKLYKLAINTAIQGSAADMVKLAMLRVDEELKGTGAYLLLQVHDELVVECPDEAVESVSKRIIDAMEHAVELSIPTPVDLKVGKKWGK